MENLQELSNIRRETKGMINVDPLQVGGILTKEAKQALVEWGDGYSVCDFCQGKLDEIKTPPVYDLVHKMLPEFIDADIVRVTGGAREGMFMVMDAIAKPGDWIIVDKNAHYTTYVSAERARLRIKEAPNSGHPAYKIDPEGYETAIKEIKKEDKNARISMLFLTWPDGNYGNYPDAQAVAKIAKENGIPFFLNAAYSIGRRPVKMNQIGADFIVGSGHKSMASAGPIGVLGLKKEWEGKVLKRSSRFKNKELEMLGCTARGVALMTLMASFPTVYKRVEEWPKQVEKARWFSSELENLEIRQLGEKPHNHDLMFFESQRLYDISQTHRRGRYFLYDEMKKRNIWGIKPGLTKHFKLSTFAASKSELEEVVKAFKEIVTRS